MVVVAAPIDVFCEWLGMAPLLADQSALRQSQRPIMQQQQLQMQQLKQPSQLAVPY